ncbi:malto-oligosyltrehalose trehalohydrolase [Spirosoma sp.]|uniref:malto-oligosyltrehalose trehalohydrolase n=1 Tax=Spirosoma sp. TaxID=1899569 RepID=UPI003B3AD196
MKTIGANYIEKNRCVFTIWAPEKKNVTLRIVSPDKREVGMTPIEWGYFQVELDNVAPGTRYIFKLDDGNEYPDPASHFQPEGVHGPSEVVDQSAYRWRDQNWRGLSFRDLIFYQLHVGTFTPTGTFEAIIPRLDALVKLGINALQLLPISQFPGERNWGYDGVYPYSVQYSYGGPNGLKKLVDACHRRGIAVFLDVVYNHLGPEGNYFSQYGPYFTDKYQTPWGNALNFDREWSDGVRDFFAENVVFWFEQYHVDGLRFDAIHEIFDRSAISIWKLIHQNVKHLEQRLGRSLYLVAETDLNSPDVVKIPELGGYGFDAQWLDDFHHAFHVQINKAGKEKYTDFCRMEQLAKAYTDGFVSSGEYVAFRQRKYGASSAGISGDRFVVFNLNHDQIGNQSGRERLSLLVDFDRQKVAAAAILLSPYVPLLFMGEEYADEAPFFYFISHSDPKLIKLVQEGHKNDFAEFAGGSELPDPIEEATFRQSKLQWSTRSRGKHQTMLRWYQTLIEIRRSLPALQNVSKNDLRVTVLGQAGFVMHRQTVDGQQQLLCLFNLSDETVTYALPVWVDVWNKLLDSKEANWRESGASEKELLPVQVSTGQTLHLPPCSVTLYSGRIATN